MAGTKNLGDMLVGVLAPFAASAYARRGNYAAGRVRAWNMIGIADLIVAVTMGFLTSRSPFQMFAFDAPNQLITTFPLAIIPAFIVPLSILLHFASLYKLRHAETELQVRDPLLAGQRS